MLCRKEPGVEMEDNKIYGQCDKDRQEGQGTLRERTGWASPTWNKQRNSVFRFCRSREEVNPEDIAAG